MPRKTEFFIFRHGQTDWNLQRRFQGHTDIQLNQTGRSEARRLKELVQKLDVEMVLSSDLARALETARIAFESLKTPIVTSKHLRETRLGEPEGMLLTEIMKKYGDGMWERWCSLREKDMDFCFPQGETKREVLSRAQNFLLSTAQEKNLSRVAVSTHGGVVRHLVHASKNAPPEAIRVPNCHLHRLVFQDEQWVYLGVDSLRP